MNAIRSGKLSLILPLYPKFSRDISVAKKKTVNTKLTIIIGSSVVPTKILSKPEGRRSTAYRMSKYAW